MKAQLYIIFTFIGSLASAQTVSEYTEHKNDSTQTQYYIIEGDTIPREFIDLEEIVLLNKLEFNSKTDQETISDSSAKN